MTGDQPFSLTAANLFVALVKRDRRLGHISSEMVPLGYRLFALEADVRGRVSRVHPDGLAVSGPLAHTMLAEWTGRSQPDERKKQQIRSYLSLEPSDLVQSAGVPRTECEQCSTWLLVSEDAAAEFAEWLDSTDVDGLLLSSLGGEDGQVALRPVWGNTRCGATMSVLGAPWVFERVPLGYVRVSLDDLSQRAFVRPVCQKLVGRAVRRAMGFTTNELSAEVFGLSWTVLGVDKRAGVANAVKAVLSRMARPSHGPAVLRRVGADGNQWELTTQPDEPPARVTARVRRASERLIGECTGDGYQMDLDLGEE